MSVAQQMSCQLYKIMNYKKIYNSIIDKRKRESFEGYGEKHHIIPRSLGGSNRASNIVKLTAKEHYMCHLLLVKIYNKGSKHHKMLHAFVMMLDCRSKNQERHITGKEYEMLRKKFSVLQSKSQTGVKNSQHGTCWIHHDIFGSRKVKKDLIEEYISQGWFSGKSFKFVRLRKTKEQISQTKQEKRNRMYPNLDAWYKIYNENGFTEMCKITGYKYSQANLVTLFSKYVESFVPQNGKKRTV
jgi:hypothetical protein